MNKRIYKSRFRVKYYTIHFKNSTIYEILQRKNTLGRKNYLKNIMLSNKIVHFD